MPGLLQRPSLDALKKWSWVKHGNVTENYFAGVPMNEAKAVFVIARPAPQKRFIIRP